MHGAEPSAAGLNGHRAPDGPGQSSPRSLQDRLLTLTDLGQLPPPEPLVDGLLYRGTVAQLSGAPGSYKSFLTLGMAASVATGEPFEGHRVTGPAPVVYVAAEGASGIRARLLAWCELTGVDPARVDEQLMVLPEPIQLDSRRRRSIAEHVELITDLGAALVVLDTRARCTVGLEENSATEQGYAVAHVELLAATGCTVLVVHHAGRNGGAGRCSTAWDGAVWSDLRVTSDPLLAKITCAKHKDVPDGCEHPFRLAPHTVSADLMPGATERQRATLVPTAADQSSRPPEDGTRRIVSGIVSRCAGPDGLTAPQIRDLAMDEGASRPRAYAAINALVETGVLLNVSTGQRPRYVIAPAHVQRLRGES